MIKDTSTWQSGTSALMGSIIACELLWIKKDFFLAIYRGPWTMSSQLNWICNCTSWWGSGAVTWRHGTLWWWVRSGLCCICTPGRLWQPSQPSDFMIQIRVRWNWPQKNPLRGSDPYLINSWLDLFHFWLNLFLLHRAAVFSMVKCARSKCDVFNLVSSGHPIMVRGKKRGTSPSGRQQCKINTCIFI